jgi:ubiquitin carboxyl-terminal hydrolase 10
VTDIETLQKHDSVHAIEDALGRMSHLQPVELGPSGISDASQQVLIEVLPPVLVLHLKRFLYDVAAGGVVKISKHVQFAPDLEIPLGTIFSFVSPVLAKAKKPSCLGCAEIMAPIAGKFAEPVRYKLYGVLYHHSKSAGSGHYTVDVLHPNGDSDNGEAWLHIDDEAVSRVRHEDLFGGSENEQVDDRCVYMLFYCQTVPTRT